MRRMIFAAVLVAVLACTSGCASRQDTSMQEPSTVSAASVEETSVDEDFGGLDDYDDYSAEDEALQNDPLEGWNRFWFHVNDWFLQYLVKPVHKGYAFIVPEGLDCGVVTQADSKRLAIDFRYPSGSTVPAGTAVINSTADYVLTTAYTATGITADLNLKPAVAIELDNGSNITANLMANGMPVLMTTESGSSGATIYVVPGNTVQFVNNDGTTAIDIIKTVGGTAVTDGVTPGTGMAYYTISTFDITAADAT